MPDNMRRPSSDEVEHVSAAKERAEADLFAIPGVHTVGVGYRRVDGELTDELAVIVYVDRKVPEDELEDGWLVPEHVTAFGAQDEPVRTDVVERPRAVEYPHLPDGSLATRVRPVPGGRSIEGGLGGGTLGGWVWDDLGDQPVLLSNNHVLGGTAGANVYQPWGSTAASDQIADNVRTGTLDATVAAPTDSDHVVYEIEGICPAVYEITEPTLGMAVEKSGATTEHTTGTIVAINLSLGHNGSTRDFEMLPDDGQLRMAYYGDSGSLIVERTHPDGAEWQRVVGLLWGGVPAEYNAYAHPISDVFDDLDLDTVCSGVVGQVLDNMFGGDTERGEFARQPEPVAVGANATTVDSTVGRRVPTVTPSRLWPPHLRRPHIRPTRPRRKWRDRLRLPRRRGLARDVERAIKKTPDGKELTALVQRHRVSLARLAVSRQNRRIAQAALEPFLEGLWSADEVLTKAVTAKDLARFRRGLSALAEHKELSDLVAHGQRLFERVQKTGSLGEALHKDR